MRWRPEMALLSEAEALRAEREQVEARVSKLAAPTAERKNRLRWFDKPRSAVPDPSMYAWHDVASMIDGAAK